ncbi:Reticulon-like protein [Trichophyton interdigitale]|uniref:Reticulon-like protein n=1 Tax=Trichophyton interdigitale TaxID=101480 RepID=A0A9P4YDM9_9EURO|nr:Reticulon-like protein [Trichophyton interdigitale]KAF3892432.1 Reticulon-like protein [Trichophyton interdigitale]KAG8207587.1 Reticulon-like protein [Trichophyton interdigitale]
MATTNGAHHPHSNGTTKPTSNGTPSSPSPLPQASQPLTHYHSKLYSLLSWERPSATASSFATVVLFIVASRYLPLIRWTLKFLYLALGVTASAEIGGHFLFSRGLTSSSRPRKYYTIPKDTMDSFLEDLENLVEFFLIEFQRILFVENLSYTVSAFVTALVSYWLVMFLPLWGLALIATCVAYLAPLVYITNKEFIDSQLGNAQEIVANQASHVKEMAETQTAQATHIVRQYVGEYRAKANGYIGSANGAVSNVTAPKAEPEPTPKAAQEPSQEAAQKPVQEPVQAPVQAPAQKTVEEIVEENIHQSAAPEGALESLPDIPTTEELPDLQQVTHAEFPEAPTGEPSGEVKEADKVPELVQIS